MYTDQRDYSTEHLCPIIPEKGSNMIRMFYKEENYSSKCLMPLKNWVKKTNENVIKEMWAQILLLLQQFMTKAKFSILPELSKGCKDWKRLGCKAVVG